MARTKINVTKTFLPDIQEYISLIEPVWKTRHISNHGKLVLELEKKLKKYLGVKHLFYVNNGTIALQIAIKALELKGDIITTPFSYVATTSSIVWENCNPVFADIDPETLCIDPENISRAITKKTTGILATHVYGHPCDVKAIQKIAKARKLKVIYDAAHAFGVKYKGTSLLNYGDISTLSFHATKLFHTAEGGAIITNDDKLAHKISYLRNFGHNGPEAFWGIGINGKSSELHAGLGLSLLPYVKKLIAARKAASQKYDELLAGLPLTKPALPEGTQYNYSYYPVLFSSEAKLREVQKKLNAASIFPRRYFYPSLNTLNYVSKQKMPIAESISKRIICLPLYHDLSTKDIQLITRIIRKCF